MSLKVIGVGGPRTGTASLKMALEQLGFGKCYHMEWVFNHTEDVAYWKELYETGTTDFERLFDGFQSTVDFPGYLNYQAFLKQYPEAKFILSERDPEAWYESALNTVFSVTPQTFGQKLGMMKKMLFSKKFREMSKAFLLVEKYLWKGLYEGRFKDKAFALNRYQGTNEDIIKTIPASQLLRFNPADGWEPLCEFLGVEAPNEPFPYKNKRKDFKEQLNKMLNTGEALVLK